MGVRQRLRNVRFFECAAVPRLVGTLRYNIQGLAFCGLFLIYDVDLVFFFAEGLMYEM
jgi:NADH:ubiquinone oxidoreductase subunit 3 (subunit A)